MKIVIPAGRYFVGEVTGLVRPIVAIPARASVFYDDSGEFEFEIAGGGSCMPDENAFGVFGLIEFEKTGLDDDFYCVIDLPAETEVVFDFDYFEIVDHLKISVCRDAGLKFTDPDEAFDFA